MAPTLRTALALVLLLSTPSTLAAQELELEPAEATPEIDAWTAFGLETGIFLAPVTGIASGYALCGNGACDGKPALVTLTIPLVVTALIGPALAFGELGSSERSSQRTAWGLTGTWPGATFGFTAPLGWLIVSRSDLDSTGAIALLSTAPIAAAVASYFLYHSLPTERAAVTVLASAWIASFVGAMTGWVTAFSMGAGNDGQGAGVALGCSMSMLAATTISYALVSD